MELHKLHVLQREARARDHGIAIARAGVRRGAGEVGAPVAAGGQHRLLGPEAMQRAVFEAQRDDAADAAVLVTNEVDGEVFDKELR